MDGKFLYDLLKGWDVGEFFGFKFKIVSDLLKFDFILNINVVDEFYGGLFVVYVDVSLDGCELIFLDM